MVLLVTGPAGSGKTTTARRWASAHPEIAAHLSVDAMSMVVKSGHVSGAATDDEARRQWLLAVAATGAGGTVYATAGVHCAVDAYLLPEHLPLWSLTENFDRRIVVLLPDLDVSMKRNAERLDREQWGVAEWQVRANHEAMSAWRGRADALIIDNTDLSLDAVIEAIRRTIP